MKKILIIMVIMIGVGVGAQGVGNTNQTGNSLGNTNQTGNSLGNTNQTGNSLGNANPIEAELEGRTSSNSSGVPKLSLKGIVTWLTGLMNQLLYLIIAASLVIFLYGILRLSFYDGQKPEAREQARKFMFWGIVSLFVMVSVWGLVNILSVTFFGSGPLIVPQLK